MEMSCSQIELPISALKCFITGPKPRQLEVGCAKSLDFTMKNRYFVGHFSIWYPRVPLMRLVPKVAFFQVLLEGLESKLPQKQDIEKCGFPQIFSNQLPSIIIPLCFLTSLDHHYYILVMMIEGSDFKGLFMSHPHFPRSSFAPLS